MKIHLGLEENHRAAAADLYWQAFGGKLGRVMGPRHKAIALVARVLDPGHCLSATEGRSLLGVAGFKSTHGAFVDGEWRDYRAIYGTVGAAWRVAALSLLERDVDNRRFLMDGIVVTEEARGQGVGTALLDAVSTLARDRGYPEVRLDVIDGNPRARALYERVGFRAVATSRTGVAAPLFGFRSTTTMVRPTGG